MFDLDGFKQVNDTIGHEAGDALLVGFAQLLRLNVLGRDVVGRLGGDEFVVILPRLSRSQGAVAIAERILEDAANPVVHGVHRLSVATSIGIALAHPVGDSREAVLHRADQAMYRAKKAGGQTWRMWTSDLGAGLDASAGGTPGDDAPPSGAGAEAGADAGAGADARG